MESAWQQLTDTVSRRGAGLWFLIDPDKTGPEYARSVASEAWRHGCDAVLLGASTGHPERFAEVAKSVFGHCPCPLLIFPNGAAQVVPHADAILFMSLLSGRNPRFLVDEQVKGAPRVAEYGLEAISTAYLLVGSGHVSSVQHVSLTQPIARQDSELAYAHALAARYLGMRLLYLEAGSGAPEPVPPAMVARCREAGLPVAVGGGVRTPEAACDLVQSGASFIVVGNRFEERPDWALLAEIASVAHSKEAVRVHS